MSRLDSLFRDLLVLQGYVADPGLLQELEARRAPAAADAIPQPQPQPPSPLPATRPQPAH